MNILWNPNEAVDILEMPLPIITEGTQDMGDGVYWLKAGTPLDEYFAVANDEDAKYVVAEDFYFISTKPDQAKVVPLITAGYVDINKAEQAAGITYSQDCIDALADEGIVLVDGTLPSSGGGGGGGGGLPPYENADINKVLTLADSGETGTRTLVAIEEQTVTTVSRFGTAELTIDYTYWTPGVTVHLTVDGNNYDCIIDDTFHIQAIVDGVTVKVWEGSGAANFLGQPSTTYTVSATIEAPVPIPAPAWVTSGGGGGGVLVVQKQVNALDFTWQEIHDAMLTGGAVVLFPDVGVCIVTRAFYNSKAGQYVVEANGLNYVTPTADGHPVEDVE